MKIIITGITGFIGSELAHKLLEQGHEVYGFVQHVISRDWSSILDIQNKIKIITCDIRDYHSVKNAIKKIEPDAILHLAALSPVRLSFEHPFEYQQSNLIGTMNIAESLMHLYGPQKVRLVVASTAEVYGIQDKKNSTESLSLNPSSPYAVSKASMDMYMRMLFKVYDFNGVILRTSNTFGRKHDTGFVTEYLISNMLSNKDVYIGAPESVRDYLHVDDHINAYILAMTVPEAKGEAFNIAGGTGFSNKEWTLKIAKELNFDANKIHFGEYPPGYPHRPLTSDQPHILLDPSKAQKILGWKQTVSVEEGLKRTIDYWRSK